MRLHRIPSRTGPAAALEALFLPAGGSDLARAAVLHLADVGDALLAIAGRA